MREPPSGMRVTFTDRGFEVALRGELPGGPLGCLRTLIPLVLGAQALIAFGCFGLTMDGEVSVPVAVVSAVGLVVLMIAEAIVLGRLNSPSPGQLVLEGETLSFTSSEGGDVTMTLEEIKGIDVVPVGLAIRPRKGTTHHVVMVDTSDEARRWLDEAIEDARKRYGTREEIPESIDRLKER